MNALATPATQRKKLAIVVASCDKYSDLWGPLFDLFFTHWGNCQYPVYLVANHMRCDHPKVTTLFGGDDLDWSTTMSMAIEGLPYSHLLFWMDDFFLKERVDDEVIERMFRLVVDKELSFLRLRPNPTPTNWIEGGIGELGRNAAYRVSLPLTIWSVDVLSQIIKKGESAWDFEINGTERSRQLPGFFCTRQEIFSYLHGVERGVWIRPAARALERLGYQLDYNHRPVMSRRSDLCHKYRRLKSCVLHMIPEQRRMIVMQAIRQIYRVLGLRKDVSS